MIYEAVPEGLLIAPSVEALKPWFGDEIEHYPYQLITADDVVYFEATEDAMIMIFLSIPQKYLC